MTKVVLCRDGLQADLERDEALWIALRYSDEGIESRFPIDFAELRAVLAGTMTYQASDGMGGSVNVAKAGNDLKVRLEVRGKGSKQCLLERERVEDAIKSLESSV